MSGRVVAKVYQPRQARLVLGWAVLLGVSLFILNRGHSGALACLMLRPCAIRPFLPACCAGLVVLATPLMLYRVTNGLPRLTLSDQGVVLETIFATRRVHWVSLGEFRTVALKIRGRRYRFIEAPVSGRSADAKTRRAGRLVVAPNNFVPPVVDLAAELNAARQRALVGLGVMAPQSAPPVSAAPAVLPPAGGEAGRIAIVFVLLFLALCAGVLIPVGADLLMLRFAGTHLRAAILAGLALASLVIAALAAGGAAGRRQSPPGPRETAIATVLVLLLLAGALVFLHWTPPAKIGAVSFALLASLVMSYRLSRAWPSRR